MTRCTEAGAYAAEFVATVVTILRATLVGGEGSGFSTTSTQGKLRKAGGEAVEEEFGAEVTEIQEDQSQMTQVAEEGRDCRGNGGVGEDD